MAPGGQILPIGRRHFDGAHAADLNRIRSLRVPTASGGTTTLDSVADISFQAGPGRLVRYDRERRASVQASLNGSTFGEALKAASPMWTFPGNLRMQGDSGRILEQVVKAQPELPRPFARLDRGRINGLLVVRPLHHRHRFAVDPFAPIVGSLNRLRAV